MKDGTYLLETQGQSPVVQISLKSLPLVILKLHQNDSVGPFSFVHSRVSQGPRSIQVFYSVSGAHFDKKNLLVVSFLIYY